MNKENIVEVRKAKFWNYRDIAKIYVEGFSEPPYNEPWTLEKAIKKIKIFSKYCDLWTIYYENRLAGFCIINANQWCPGEVAYGEEIAIKKNFREKGIASFVLKFLFDFYKNRGYKQFVCIASRKGKALKLYKRLGFVESKLGVQMEKRLK